MDRPPVPASARECPSPCLERADQLLTGFEILRLLADRCFPSSKGLKGFGGGRPRRGNEMELHSNILVHASAAPLP